MFDIGSFLFYVSVFFFFFILPFIIIIIIIIVFVVTLTLTLTLNFPLLCLSFITLYLFYSLCLSVLSIACNLFSR
ncbi:hypothetical protein F4703DRAFT_1824345 [Phycomyces blakesleeanus]